MLACAAALSLLLGPLAVPAGAAHDEPVIAPGLERMLERPVNGLQDEVDAEWATARTVALARAEALLLAQERRARLVEMFTPLPAGVSRATLESIASCESGGDPGAVSADGSYRGKYQFSVPTWQSVGGDGDPAAAPEIEQDYRAALLYVRSGPGQWPICGS